MSRNKDNMAKQIQTLQWQYHLTWRLAEIHLPALTDALCLWEPVPGSWTVRKSKDGTWHPDWVEPEPNPAPPVTIGWLTWHLIWWWSSLLVAVKNQIPPAYHEVAWPGNANAVVHRLKALSTAWGDALSRLGESDLEKIIAFPWKEQRQLRFTIAWANSELMKNIAEIGYARHLYEAAQNSRSSK